MVGHKTSILNRRDLVLWLTGFTVLYQIVYQGLMWRALQEEESDGWGVCAPGASSQHCQEAQLFSNWAQQAAPHIATTTPTVPDGLALISHFDSQKKELLENHISQEENLFGKLTAQLKVVNASAHQADVIAWQSELDRLRQLLEEHDLPALAAQLKSYRNVTAERTESEEGSVILDAPKKLRGSKAPAANASVVHKTHPARAEHAALRARIAKELEEQTATLLHGWAEASAQRLHETQELQQAAMAEMCAHPLHKNQPACLNFTKSTPQASAEIRAKGVSDQKKQHDRWEHDFVDQVEQLHHELCKDPERRHRKDCLEYLASHPTNHDDTWQDTFKETLRQAQIEMCQEPHRRGRADCVELLSSISQAETHERKERRLLEASEFRKHTELVDADLAAASEDHAAWEKQFSNDIHAIHREMCMEPHRRNREDCVEFLAADSKESSRSLLSEIREQQRKMCHEASRRGRPDCVKLLASLAKAEREERAAADMADLRQHTAALEAGLQAASENHEAWEREFETKVQKARRDIFGGAVERADGSHESHAQWSEGFMRELRRAQRDLCEDPSRRDRSDCVRLLASLAQAEQKERKVATQPLQAAKTALRQGRKQLHWSQVREWASAGWLQRGFSRGQVVVARDELEKGRWGGLIPKVACITAVPAGTTGKQMKELIDSFHHQTYEGPSQLILVYHYQDDHAAELVSIYSDGYHIKGVAARDDGEFPSTTALRYGLWVVAQDAQVIAQWDFSEQHHPQRLSIQVRALAHAARPASLLLEGAGTLAEHTLVGEFSWMKQHWHPLLDKQREVLLDLEETQIVQVTMLNPHADGSASIRTSMDKHIDNLINVLSPSVPEDK